MPTNKRISFFARTILGRPLYPYQEVAGDAILDSVLREQGLTFTVMCARQMSKNQLSAILEAYLALKYPYFPRYARHCCMVSAMPSSAHLAHRSRAQQCCNILVAPERMSYNATITAEMKHMTNDEHLSILNQGYAVWNAWRNEHEERRPDLSDAILSRADLSGATLRYALVGETHFASVDLRAVKGLESVEHRGPSHLSTSTLERSQGEIPEVFLRGVGLDDTFIAYVRSLVSQPIQYYTCFISYSSKDQACAERLYADLQSKGVRCWYAPHDLQPGTYIHAGIDEAIRAYDKLLLILSEHSVKSKWVHFEVVKAQAREAQRDQLVLFPIRLDDTVMTTTQPWAVHLREERSIGDFTQWETHGEYQKKFTDLFATCKRRRSRRTHASSTRARYRDVSVTPRPNRRSNGVVSGKYRICLYFFTAPLCILAVNARGYLFLSLEHQSISPSHVYGSESR